jgi:hypothetical protein
MDSSSLSVSHFSTTSNVASTSSSDNGSHHQESYSSSSMQVRIDNSRRHLYAQKLNNSACMCIEIGQYDRAILFLAKALRISEQQQQDNTTTTTNGDDDVIMSNGKGAEYDESQICSCYNCTVDGCIEFSENNTPTARLMSGDTNSSAFCRAAVVKQKQKYQTTLRPSSSNSSIHDDNDDDDDDDDDDSYIY